MGDNRCTNTEQFGNSPLEADWRRSGAFKLYLAGDHLSEI